MLEYVNLALANWSFFAAAAILWALNETLKKVFKKKDEKRFHALVWAFLPLWPVLLGGIFGAFHGAPIPSVVREFGSLAGPLYFASAGLFAIHVRDLILTYIKYFHSEFYAKAALHREESIPPDAGA